ncbi:MAG: hypothetical protein GY827_11915 [Cytophagales bacterium]|nr:hypothetical protein [Cytophagales bacterium]
MKQLLLIRHAEAESSHGKDFDRALTQEGIYTSLKVGIKLQERDINIQKMVVSSALRTRMTTQYLTERLTIEEENIEYKEEMYLASVRIWLQEVVAIANEYDCVAFVGHNPELSYFAEYLTGEQIGLVNPCTVLSIQLEVDDWGETSQNIGILNWEIRPETLD